jgi:hypothetical protein
MVVRPLEGTVPFTAQLTVEKEHDEDGFVVKREWLLSDGSVLSGKSAEALFEIPGIHQIALVLTDNLGGQSIYFAEVVAKETFSVIGVKASATQVDNNNTVGVSCDFAGEVNLKFFDAETLKQVNAQGIPSTASYKLNCNSIQQFGPWQKPGAYKVEAVTSLACTKCKATDAFNVNPKVTVQATEIHPLLVLGLLFALLFVLKRRP